MIRDGQLLCDACQKVISRITEVPDEGWAKMHNLCSACFAALGKESISRA
ncbi:MAG: hypothetical protein ACRECT_03180 [Thermoplasmata archaeon]